MITLEKGEAIQKKCSTFTEEKRSGSGVVSTDNTHEPGGGMLLDCSRSRVCRIQEESVQYLYYENAYKGRGVTHVIGSGSVHKWCSDT